MSRGAYQRGSRLVAREADARVKLLDESTDPEVETLPYDPTEET